MPRAPFPLPLVALLLLLAPLCRADQTALLDDLTFPGRWQPEMWNRAPGQLRASTEAPPGSPEGEGSLEATIAWPQDDEFRFFNLVTDRPRGPIPYPVREVSVWVKTSDSRHFIEAHFRDPEGKDLKVGWAPAATPEGLEPQWQRLVQAIPLDWPQPLTFTSLTWHNWGLKGAGGTRVTLVARPEVVLDTNQRLAAAEDKPLVLCAAADVAGIADDDGTSTVALRVLSWLPGGPAVTATEQLADGGEPQTVEVAPGGPLVRLERLLPRYGAYTRTITLGGGAGGPFAVNVARVPPVPGHAGERALTEAERRASPIGVNTHVGAPWAAFGRLGIHWARDYSWGWLGHGESAPFGNGRDFGAVWSDAAAAGVEVLPITQAAFRNQAGTGFDEDSGAITAGFKRLATAFPKVPYWEIDNEFEFGLRDQGFDLEDYHRALQAAAEGLRQAGAAKLVTNGTAGIRDDMARALLASEARDASPVINSHFYTGTQPPEVGVEDSNSGGPVTERLTFAQRLRDMSRLAHEAGKEHWLTEIGWDVSQGPCVGEGLQAVYLPRAYLLSMLCGVDRVFWFYDRDIPGGSGIFSTCGLIRLDGSVRPSGVAMAALSREVCRATVAGSLDLGEGTRAVLLRQPEGGWTLAAWCVEGTAPLPAELAGVPARDMLGNDVTPTALGPQVTYFHLPQLLANWDRQRQAVWDSPDVLAAYPSGEVTARVRCPEAQVTWADLPVGVTAGPWQREGDGYVDTLQVAPTTELGARPVKVSAAGDGWQRSWTLTLAVRPALQVGGPVTYEPNQPSLLTVTSELPQRQVSARLVGDDGVVAPARFTLRKGAVQRLAVVPSEQAQGVLTVELSLPEGVRQEYTLRPETVALPSFAGDMPPADLALWPAEALLPTDPGQATTLHAMRTGRGIAVAARFPIRFLAAGNPESFWDFTNLEVFADPAGGNGGWTESCRQVWLTPVRENGGWGVAAGQWRRIGATGAAREERCQTVVIPGGEWATLAVLVPWEVLGRTPQAQERWRLGVSFHGASAGNTVQIAWPRAKDEGLLEGPRGWGHVEFR